MPLCTRVWTTATIVTSVLVQCKIITPFQLFYSFRAVFVKNQVGLQCMHRHNSRDTDQTLSIVLATCDNIPLLRPTLPRPALPCLLPPTILPVTRGEQRTLSCTFLMAPTLCYHTTPLPLTFDVNTIPRFGPQQQLGIYLEQTESRDEVELPWPLGLHRAVPAMGSNGIFFGTAWDSAKG